MPDETKPTLIGADMGSEPDRTIGVRVRRSADASTFGSFAQILNAAPGGVPSVVEQARYARQDWIERQIIESAPPTPNWVTEAVRSRLGRHPGDTVRRYSPDPVSLVGACESPATRPMMSSESYQVTRADILRAERMEIRNVFVTSNPRGADSWIEDAWRHRDLRTPSAHVPFVQEYPAGGHEVDVVENPSGWRADESRLNRLRQFTRMAIQEEWPIDRESIMRDLADLSGVPATTLFRTPRPTITTPALPTPTVLETPNWTIRQALDAPGAMTLGRQTAWCTARSHDLADDYTARGRLYVLQGVNGNKSHRKTRYQLHVSHAGRVEFRRHDERSITPREMADQWPELAPWLREAVAQ